MAETPCARSASTDSRTSSSWSGTSTRPFASSRSRTPPRRQERRGLRIHREVVHARALHPPELEHILEARGGEDGRDRAFLLEDRVGGHGGAVDEAFDVARLSAG